MKASAAAPLRVVVVELGRKKALGAQRRVETWNRLWTGAGASVEALLLMQECSARLPEASRGALRSLCSSDVALETMAWSQLRAARLLRELTPDVIVFTTARAFHPALLPESGLAILDFVDRLSENYRRRAGLASSPLHRTALSLLGRRMQKVEERPLEGLVRTAAGRADAAALNAQWVPNVLVSPPSATGEPDTDLVFIGSLDYAPNVDALRRMAAVWPAVQRIRPGTTMLVAGASPSPVVQELAARHGWEVLADFADLDSVCARARVSVAPVAQATGMQNKVIETAARGLPQVVHPAVLEGLDPEFPALVAPTEAALVAALVHLLGDEGSRTRLGAAGRRHVESRYTPQAWVPWCESVLDQMAARTRARIAG